ncbi:GNAT family N-acetyltransferase [Oceanobacillus halotolerans]|uniref:GNAT family N-acetyltransferase n=1 Tax=Oceanobacillus halotolerans TaxID=2663380 RepID=UPI0013DABB85|nr:GNAT family N-acetyltransferase [Oceanobacillus halotolerans]
MLQTEFPLEEDTRSKKDLKEELDTLEIQLFRMQENMKQIAKQSEIVSIDQSNQNNWVIIYINKDRETVQLMLHDCQTPFRGKWHSAIQAEYKSTNRLHIADIKGEENQGYGSILMNHLKEMVRSENVQYITGDIVKRDFDHVDRLQYFYRKHNFEVDIDHEAQYGRIIWNDG